MKVLPIKYIFLFTIIQLINFGLNGQNNLLRNSSFEQRVPATSAQFPYNQVQLDGYCRYWVSYGMTTSDWFDNTPNHLHGSDGCGNSTQFWNAHPAIPNLDGTHYAGVYAWSDRRGEGLQQRMPHKLRNKTYILSFSYYIPCDTNPYIFDLFFGKAKNDTSLHIKFDTLNREDAGQWHTYQYTFNILPTQDNMFDWFVWVFDGDPGDPTPGTADGSYLFVDDMKLVEFPLTCTACDPNGLISWNNQSIRPYLTPDNDGNFDEWCISNINNVSWYEFSVIDRWGVTVYEDIQTNANGFENLSLCWDGRNNNGQMLQVPNDYQIVVRLGNCGAQITALYQVWSSNDLAHNAFSVAQNYVPPLFGLEPSPTHYRELHLYGGPYYGTHDWYACDSIVIGNDGAPRVPYFWAASTSNLGFHFGLGFDTHAATDFRIDPGADIDIVPEPVQCCPALRLANPNLPDPKVSDIGELPEIDDLIDPEDNGIKMLDNPRENEFDEFSLHVYPVPANDFLKIDFYLPNRCEVKATLTSTSGIVISEILRSELLDAGDHSYSISARSIPNGMYFLQLSRSSGVTTVKVIVQR